MFARVTRIKGLPEKTNDIVNVVSSSLLPNLETSEGFSGGLLLVDRESGKLMAVTFWREEKDIKASDFEAAAWRAKIVKLVPETSQIETEMYDASYMPPGATTLKVNKIWVRVIRFQGAPTVVEATINLVYSIFYPILHVVKGYISGIFLADTKNNRLMGITIWSTAKERDASDEIIKDLVAIAEATEVFHLVRSPEIENYELTQLPAQVPG